MNTETAKSIKQLWKWMSLTISRRAAKLYMCCSVYVMFGCKYTHSSCLFYYEFLSWSNLCGSINSTPHVKCVWLKW